MWWTRLKALIIKELLAVLRDPKSRTILIVPPIIQLLVFSYAATLEVRNVDILVLNRDSGHWSEELIKRIEGSPTFRSFSHTQDQSRVQDSISNQAVIAALEIGSTFSRDIEAGRPATVQIILDGRKSNASQIVAGYLSQIVGRLSLETPSGMKTQNTMINVVPRNWFNPNLDFQWFMVPNLIASIAMLIGLIVTALSIARERELGTFDQLIVSPLRTHEIVIGKLIPPMMIGIFHMTMYLLAAIFLFQIPFRGSLIYLYGGGIIYLAAIVGIGLFISALSKTQQQAILGAFLFIVPAILLSGFATPIENMPQWLQPITLINPLRYFLVIIKGLFLKDIGPFEVLHQTIPLALIAVVTLSAAAWLFRRRLE
ncbi:ABC transporter permease [Phyllobacterium sp. SB3]|uniref:ABC transporter permease n=1 Tax=Phyllobacterium sp. SB3 TaxID=3156073 RepID=UPI0032AFA527